MAKGISIGDWIGVNFIVETPHGKEVAWNMIVFIHLPWHLQWFVALNLHLSQLFCSAEENQGLIGKMTKEDAN